MKPSDLIRPGECGCGCGQRTSLARSSWAAKGRVKGEPLPFVRHHSTRAIPRIDVTASGCWEWHGRRDLRGYGRLKRDGRYMLAHRWVYLRLVGEVPDGLHLDHLCRNTSCVNPEHLEPVTSATNVRRGEVASRLTMEMVREMRREAPTMDCSQREAARRLGARYGVSAATIRAAITGLTWAEEDELLPLIRRAT